MNNHTFEPQRKAIKVTNMKMIRRIAAFYIKHSKFFGRD